ncbi:restriction endonuclease subunit S [Amycolatopsis sp. CA-230715]|uniref:restriction endonuclease subunit S n=1 Tax=Amycolatopsis sp. CA-230715 TaxID=2745196 RepID=UPI001C01CDC2|nr:restriction endonuclease subunit S [Amycolatopsis sp. CA-230715]
MTEWRSVKLGEAAKEVTVGFVGSMSKEYQDAGIPFLRSQNVRPHRIDVENMKFISESFHGHLKKSALKPGDVVTVRTGKPGQTAVVPSWLTVANCSDLVITRPGPGLDAHWLSYHLNWITDSHISGHLVGAVQQHFNVKSAQSLDILLPPIEEQQAIAEALKALDDKIAVDDFIASKSIELAELNYKRSISDKARRSMSSVLEPVLGGTPPRTDESMWGGPIAWASAKDITGAPYGIVISTSETISKKAAEKKRTSPLPTGTVVLTARGTVGAVARLGVPSSINQSCYGFIPGPIPTNCLFFTVKDAANQAQAMAHGSVFDTITMNTFDHVRVPDLSTHEWQLIEKDISPLVNFAQQRLIESAALENTRDSLLPLLMSGKIRVRDAEKVVEEVV